MKTSKASIEMIKSFETKGTDLSDFLIAYHSDADPAGVYTIGYGHTKDVHEGMKIFLEQAETLLIEDLAKF